MTDSDLKQESWMLLEFIESLAETEWRKCVNSQYSIKEHGLWVIKDQSSHPPTVSFRFKVEEPELILRLKSAVESYEGRVKWALDGHKRDRLPGMNWTIEPSRLFEVKSRALELNLAPNQFMAKYEPEFGPVAYEDIIDLTEYIKNAFLTNFNRA